MSSDSDKVTKIVVDALESRVESASQEELERLESARLSALSAIPESVQGSGADPYGEPKWKRSTWLSGLSFASILVVALMYFQFEYEPTTQDSGGAQLTVQDVEWILGSDELDVFTEDLSFYEWMDAELSQNQAES